MTGRAILDYHEATKHSYESIREGGAGLDWSNEPSPFKEYRGLDTLGLPRFEARGIRAIDAIAGDGAPPASSIELDALSYLLFHAAGVSRTVRAPHQQWYFRTYASAGALYPNEVYVVSGELPSLEAGVYHYAPRAHGLVRIRDVDTRGDLGLGANSAGAISLVISGVPWRTAWKYGARGFRHLYWDAGMIVANVLACAAALGIEARVCLGFRDGAANEAIAVDGVDEFALCVVTLGAGSPPAGGELETVRMDVEPISPRPRRDPTIEAARAAIELPDDEAAARFREAPSSSPDPVPAIAREEGTVTISPLPRDRLSSDSLERVIRRRGSTRALAPIPFPATEYAALQDLSLSSIPADWGAGGIGVHVIANALEGLQSGAYAYRRGGIFETAHVGETRRKAGFVCLEQRLGAEAAAVVVLGADIANGVEQRGPRGYAAAQLEAAIIAGRLYLAAYAQCLGASGIIFYDDEARRMFGTTEEPMLAVVLGPEAARASVIRCRERIEEAAS